MDRRFISCCRPWPSKLIRSSGADLPRVSPRYHPYIAQAEKARGRILTKILPNNSRVHPCINRLGRAFVRPAEVGGRPVDCRLSSFGFVPLED